MRRWLLRWTPFCRDRRNNLRPSTAADVPGFEKEVGGNQAKLVLEGRRKGSGRTGQNILGGHFPASVVLHKFKLMVPAFNGTAVWPTLANFTAATASLFAVWFVTLVGICRYRSIIIVLKRQVVFPDFIFEIAVILFVANVESEEIVVVFF
jgi:hypothetical protein